MKFYIQLWNAHSFLHYVFNLKAMAGIISDKETLHVVLLCLNNLCFGFPLASPNLLRCLCIFLQIVLVCLEEIYKSTFLVVLGLFLVPKP